MGRHIAALLTLVISVVSRAAEITDAEPEIAHPVISTDIRWMVVILIIALAIMLAAMIVGPVVRANTPQETQPAPKH